VTTSRPVPDPWLQPWLPLLWQHAGPRPVLELGCGAGEDTATLVAAGLKVQAIDLSAESLARARMRVPGAHLVCQDVRRPWPDEDQPRGVVVASLSLHYFAWDETLALVARIRDALVPGGLLLCRLNSTEDHHFGASGHPAIAPHYYLVDGQPKRFFDRADVEALFAHGWRHESVSHQLTGKYGPPKALWELVLTRADAAAKALR